MATQLFLLDTVASTHLGTDSANTSITPANVGWTSRALGTARGSGVVASDATPTVTFSGAGGPTLLKGGTAVEWISPPVSADVTISGTITGNAWASESNMSANVVISMTIEIIRANATATRNSNTFVTLLGLGTFQPSSEVAVTTRAVNNFTRNSGTYTAQTLNRGDRIRVVIYGAAIGTQAATFTFNASYNGTTAAADGDTYVTFTENFSFESAPGVLVQSQTSDFTNQVFGTPTHQQDAQSFVANGDLTEVQARLYKSSAPTDNMVLEYPD